MGGRVVEEWTVEDETALIRQLGLDEIQLARTRARADFERGLPPTAGGPGELPRGGGQLPPPLELPGDPCF